VLFHCRLGKERTGVFAVLLLNLLGVGDDEVTQDYLLTSQYEPATRELLASHEDAGAATEPAVARQPVSRDAIEGLLQRLVSQYGGAYGYFARFGVTADEIDAFVEGALEPVIAPQGYGGWSPFAHLQGRGQPVRRAG
jgi:protein-tyrosine phosphatase